MNVCLYHQRHNKRMYRWSDTYKYMSLISCSWCDHDVKEMKQHTAILTDMKDIKQFINVIHIIYYDV